LRVVPEGLPWHREKRQLKYSMTDNGGRACRKGVEGRFPRRHDRRAEKDVEAKRDASFMAGFPILLV
jgi:hypothetical protein